MAARYEQWAESRLYRAYTAECARVCTENTAALGGGKLMPVSYEDLLLRKAPQQDKRTGDEIAADVIKRAGLKVVRKDNERI